MKRTLLFSILAAALAVASCKKSDNNSSYKQTTLSYRLTASNTNYAVAKTTAVAGLQWTSAVAYPDVIKFEAKKDNVQVEFKSKNNGPIDLMASAALTFGNFTIPAGIYDEIELKIDLDRDGMNPVLQLNGQFTSPTLTVPVVIEITNSVELKTEQHDVLITSDDDYIAVTTLDLSMLTAGITADMLLNAQLTGGSIVISASANHDLYVILLDNLQHRNHHCEFEHHHH